MADELKSMLTRVLQTKGKTRYFFAYGTGKRTDGKGDGHLAVDVKKPKKVDVQKQCACQLFTEGHCWSSSDGGTIYFVGKPTLNVVAVAKMSLTAKKLTSRAYDFQLPSAEAETQSESLAADDEAAPSAGPTAPPAAVPPPPPPPPIRPAPKAPVAPTAGGGAQGLFTQRLKALLPVVAKATAANHPAAAEMKLATSEVGVHARKQDYAQANALLDRVEKLLAQPANGTAPESPHPEAAAKDRFAQRLKALLPEIAKATAAKHPAAAEMKLAASEVGVHAKKQDYAQANALLDRVETLLAKPANGTAPPEPAKTEASPKGDLVAMQRARLLWVQTRQAVRGELLKLEKVILETTKAEPDFAAISTGTKNLFAMLDVLDERLVDTLDEALNAETPEKRSVLHRDAREIVEEYVAYVGSEPLLADIDANGFTAVKVRSSLNKTLQYLSTHLK